ncbi:MAG TPA: lysophospholipase [Acholeplasma sp.]|nr:lysophospholipase [Acholeplasma sp.]
MQIFSETHFIENEKARIFIVHGIAEHSKRYTHVAKFLNDSGYSAVTFDLRGHGESDGKRGYINKYETFLEDIHVLFHKYKSDHVKNVLLGHSMGGLITHLYMIDYDDFDMSIISAAPSNFISDVLILRLIGFRYFGFINKKNELSYGKLSHVKQVEDRYMSDPLVLKKFSIRLIGEMFVRGVRYLKNNLYMSRKPILLLHGKKDKIVPYQFTENVYDSLITKDKTLKLYEDDFHEILNEYDKDVVLTDIKEWLDSHL